MSHYKSNLKVFPYNLLEDLFGLYVPKVDSEYYDMNFIVDNIDKNLSFLFERNKKFFTDQKKDMFISYYKYFESQSYLGVKYGITRERARAIINDCLRVVGNPQNLGFILFGIDLLENKIINTQVKLEQLQKENVLEKSISILNLSKRSYKALTNNGITTIEQLLEIRNTKSLKDIKGIGKKSATEIRRKIRLKGIE